MVGVVGYAELSHLPDLMGAIADAVARGRRCVYTAPIKALSNQKYRDFRAMFGNDVGLIT